MAIHEDLGPNALVLSTRTIPSAGLRGWLGRTEVEVTAAVERPPLSGERHLERGPGPDVKSSQAIVELAARLEAGGMEPALAREIATAHPAHGRRGATVRALHHTLADRLTPFVSRDTEFARVEVFVGPPGAGKTTTIAKIAAQERARGGRPLALLSADGFRVGAVEQLRQYADILGAPFAAARSLQELERALLDIKRPVLLDTAGRSPSDGASRELFQLLARRPGVRTHLVVPAGTTGAALRALLARFTDARPDRVVITKLDEAGTVAPLLGALRDRELPISYLGTGQAVPDHLEIATGATLASWVTGENDTQWEGLA